jgi:nucleotidyltransferase substrate binding protein (TIGR01987 family)
MFIGHINIDSLLKVFKRFESFRKIAKSEIEQAGVIQAFEYTFELAWKTMKKILEENGMKEVYPRDVFRAAAAGGLINDPEAWFDYLEKRNITSHTYDEDKAELVLSICENFAFSVKAFLKNIGVSDDQSGNY